MELSRLEDLDIPLNRTINVHHCKEGNGNDRMYITHKEDCYLYFCHHCGKKGKVSKSLVHYTRATQKPVTQRTPKGATPPSDAVYKPSQWPVGAVAWCSKAGLNLRQIEEQMFWWSESLGRVGMPVIYDGYRGYIARNITAGEDAPKYLVRRKGEGGFIFRRRIDKQSKRVVIVEDALSCIRLSYIGVNAVALQGTALTDEMVNHLIDNYDEYILWLDDDKPEVKIKQVNLKQTLSLFGKVSMRKTPRDPKEYNNHELGLIISDGRPHQLRAV